MVQTEEIIGRYVNVDGTRIFYDEVGNGIPIVCVHTAGANSLEYRYILPILAKKGFHAVAPDLPGRTRSYPINWEPNRSIHAHAEWLYRFIQTVCDQKPIIVGCSIGGDIVLDFVAHHSDAVLAAIAMEGAARTPTFPNPQESELPAWMPGWQDVMERVSSASLHPDCPPEKRIELNWIHRNAQISAVGDLEGWATHDVRHLLGNVRCPVLVFKGEADFWVPNELLEETAKLIPGVETKIVKGVGHYPMFEKPELIADIIEEFVKRRLEI